jgi:hypothetical protein
LSEDGALLKLVPDKENEASGMVGGTEALLATMMVEQSDTYEEYD